MFQLNDTRTPLTTEMDREMNEWNRQTDIAKATRVRVNYTEMDFDAILVSQNASLKSIQFLTFQEGAVVLKRYALYLTTQACELMPQP